MLHKAECPTCRAPFGVFEGVDQDVLNEIKKRGDADEKEMKQEIAEEDRDVAIRMQLAEAERALFGMFVQLNQLGGDDDLPPLEDDSEDEDIDEEEDEDALPVIPMDEEEREHMRNTIQAFFMANYAALGHVQACQQAHALVHEMRDNEFMVSNCTEINEIIAGVLGLE
jgi:hypothetical protein